MITTKVIIIRDHSSEKLFIFTNSLQRNSSVLSKIDSISDPFVNFQDRNRMNSRTLLPLTMQQNWPRRWYRLSLLHKMSNAKCSLLTKKILAKIATIFKSTQYPLINQPQRTGEKRRFLFVKKGSAALKAKWSKNCGVYILRQTLTIPTI